MKPRISNHNALGMSYKKNKSILYPKMSIYPLACQKSLSRMIKNQAKINFDT